MRLAAQRIQPDRPGRKIFFVFLRSQLLAILQLLGVCLWGLPLLAQTATTGASHSFLLHYAEKNVSLSSVINAGKQEVKFRKEPAFGKDQVLRRALQIGPNKNDFIGFAVDLTRRTLYLDLNQNLDLTDDPDGVYQGQGGRAYASFANVRLNLRKNGVVRSYLLDPFYFYGRGDAGYIAVKSSYQGEIELYGQKYWVEVQDNLDGVVNRQDQFSIAVSAEAGRAGYRPMPVATKLFLSGHQYQLNFTFEAGPGVSPLIANVTEISSPLGELVIDGQFIRRLVLEGDAGLAILDSPTQPIFLPVGKYFVQAVYLQSALSKPALTSNVSRMPQFSVTAGTPYHLRVGGPLESSVTATASGNFLKLSYVLKGVGDEQYSVSNQNSGKPPGIAIYQGDRQLAAGNFQFG
jgi:hypothetical protein